MEIIELFKLATPLLAIGGAWGGAKVALNGTRDRVMKLEQHEEKQDAKLERVSERLVRIETKQDTVIAFLKENK